METHFNSYPQTPSSVRETLWHFANITQDVCVCVCVCVCVGAPHVSPGCVDMVTRNTLISNVLSDLKHSHEKG